MARIPAREGKLLYHLTSLDNLPSIFSQGLVARDRLNEFTDIADKEIIEHRKAYNLTAYVPFHFFPLTPFAGIVQKNHQDKDFVYITISRNIAKEHNFEIIPTHPLTYRSEPLSFQEGLANINWELIDSRNYLDPDCKAACMAECITKKIIRPSAFHCIYVKSEAVKTIVTELYKLEFEKSPTFYVNVSPSYFKKHD